MITKFEKLNIKWTSYDWFNRPRKLTFNPEEWEPLKQGIQKPSQAQEQETTVILKQSQAQVGLQGDGCSIYINSSSYPRSTPMLLIVRKLLPTSQQKIRVYFLERLKWGGPPYTGEYKGITINIEEQNINLHINSGPSWLI